MEEPERENGNILFIILIAVALFAALSYAVTQSSRGGSKDASAELLELHTSEIFQYVASVQNALLRLRVVNGCTATENTKNMITFQYDSDGDGDWNDNDEDYHNPTHRRTPPATFSTPMAGESPGVEPATNGSIRRSPHFYAISCSYTRPPPACPK
jgi:type II secretory pathway pseudopilin PulG